LSRPDHRFREFRINWNKIRRGEEMSREDWMNCRAQAKDILEQVLSSADVVVTTLSQAGEEFMRRLVTPSVIAIDEAAKASEPEMWNVLAGYRECPVILVGDDRQLSPTVISSYEANNFARQLQLSF